MVSIDIKYGVNKELLIPIKNYVIVGKITQKLLHYLHGFVKQFKWLCITLWYYLVGQINNMGVALSCQKYSFNHLILKYMYRISYKSARKENHLRKVCPYDIRKHNVFEITSSFDLLQKSNVPF